MLRWISTYVRGRTSSVTYQGVVSPPRIIHAGNAQGSVLSPDFFNFYTSDYVSSAALSEEYADDNHQGETDVDIDAAAARLSVAVSEYDDWARSKNLKLAPAKSTTTLFTPDTHQSRYHPLW